MNTVRISRPAVDVGRGPAGTLVRTMALAAVLCAAAFAASFEIGRAERPGGTPSEHLPSLPAAAAGAAIPARLGSAPAIADEAPAAASTPAVAPTPAASHVSTSQAPSSSSTPAAQTPAAPTTTAPAPTTPAATTAPTRPQPQSSTGGTSPASRGGSSGSSGGAAKPEASGTPFDSSG